MAEQTQNSLVAGRLLAKNTFINVVGIIVPLLVAAFSIPLLIQSLGTERFGILSLAWVFTGYFNLFDLGLGRAVTQMISERLGLERNDELPSIFWTSQVLMSMMGIIGMVLILLFAQSIVERLFNIPLELENETLNTVRILSVIIPLVTSTTGLRGYLQAHQRFDLVNYIRIPFGAYVFLGPLAVALLFTTDLAFIGIILALGRFVVWLCYFFACVRVSPELTEAFEFRRQIIRPMISYGGWMTVSNIIGPLMVYFDRFIVGGIISTAAVAYYTVPQEIVTKILLVPNAFVSVLFPAFAFVSARSGSYLSKLLNRSIAFNTLFVFPIVLLLIGFAYEGLLLWLGEEYAVNGFRPLQWLALGAFLNVIGIVPYALLQGIGRPDVTAKLHLVELPIYLGLVYWLTMRFGLSGTAFAWTFRIAFDTFGLLLAVYILVPALQSATKTTIVISGVSLSIFAIFFVSIGVNLKIMMTVTILCVSVIWGYRYLLLDTDRAAIHDKFNSFMNRYSSQ